MTGIKIINQNYGNIEKSSSDKMSMKKNILITGDKGFVGSNLVVRLKDLYKITVLDEIDQLQDNKKKYNIIYNQFITKYGTQNKIDGIIHLAAKTSIMDSIARPYETYLTNIIGTLNLLEFARISKIKNFIFLSTYIFGKPEYMPVDENHRLEPHSPYNKSKLIAENLCKIFSEDYKINVVVLRPFYLYGKNNKPSSLIPQIINKIEKSEKVVLSRKFTKRDFLYIDDFVELIFKILKKFPKGYNDYNVGYGVGTKIEDVAKKISVLMNKKVEIKYQKNTRPIDIIDMAADTTKVSTQFGWKPNIGIDEGLKLILENG